MPVPVPRFVPEKEVVGTFASMTNDWPLSVMVKLVPATRLFNSSADPVAWPKPSPVPVLDTEVKPAPPDAPVLVALTNAFSLTS